ncbi:MAG: hypothetical protein M1817_000703 [Caeruleum heppii]|nr:MAG: hypothetical protein M1817_000703 [Caeruleum heppii]
MSPPLPPIPAHPQSETPASSVTILVHVSAPSGFRDDTRFRNEVEGYLSFSAQTSTRGNKGHAADEDGTTGEEGVERTVEGNRVARCIKDGDIARAQKATAASSSAISAECSFERGYEASNEHSSSSGVGTTAQSPQTKPASAREPQTIYETIEEVSSSITTSTSTSISISPTRKRLRSIEQGVSPRKSLRKARFSSSGVEHDEKGKGIPRPQESQGDIRSSRGRNESNAQENCAPSKPVTQAPAKSPPPSQVQLLSSSTSSPCPILDPPSKTTTSPSKPISIYAPPPPTSSLPPPSANPLSSTTHLLTPTLLTLLHNLPAKTHFEPQIRSQTRDIHAGERGCWALDTSKLEEERVGGLLKFLRQVIEEGRVGWTVGMWYGDWGDDLVSDNQDRRKGRDRGTVLKLYHPAALMSHIWLLLLVASQRTIRGKAARWIDAAGRVVIVMH